MTDRASIGPEKPLRRAGGRWVIRVSAPEPGTPPWRLKVDEWAGRRDGEREGMYGVSHNLLSHPREGRLPDSPDPVNEEWSRHYVLPATELDEVVVGRWCHLEQMDTGRWWCNIAGVTLWIEADREGRPTSVRVYGPQDYDQPVPGVTYAVDWHGEGLVSERAHQWMRDTVAELVRTRGEGGKAEERAWQRAEIALLGEGTTPTRSEVLAALPHDDLCASPGPHCECGMAQTLDALVEHGWLRLADPPTVENMAGTLGKDWTGGLGSAEYVRRQRDPGDGDD